MEDLVYSNDPDHPIPQVDVVDIIAAKKSGEVVLAVVIATPLQADERSQKRLLAKLENYLTYIQSDKFSVKYGAPISSKTSIEVNLAEGSDDIILDLLVRCTEWARNNGASLVVKKRPAPQLH
nr:Unknown Function [uncultured bacterium]